MSADSVDQPIRLQQPNLPNLETDMHLENAELIANVEKKFLKMQNFLSLLPREQATAFQFPQKLRDGLNRI